MSMDLLRFDRHTGGVGGHQELADARPSIARDDQEDAALGARLDPVLDAVDAESGRRSAWPSPSLRNGAHG